jgi:uncharacterized protein YkwD
MIEAARGEDLTPAEGPRVLIRPAKHALLSLLTAVALAGSATLVAAGPADATTTRAARMVAKINYARAAHGLPLLHTSRDLMAAAKSHSASMAGQQLLFHTASFSSLCCWDAIAENVGMGYSVDGLHRAFMRSAPHRANILDRRMRQVGVGFTYANGRLWVTEIFRSPPG